MHSFDDLEQWVWQREEEIDANPAAWCAVELALLEALSQERAQSVEATLGLSPVDGIFHYTAVLGDAAPAVLQAQVDQYAAWGFVDFKVKITGDPEVDNRRFAMVTRVVQGARLRLDANNLWRCAAEVSDYLGKIGVRPFAIEEPLRAMDYEGLFEVARDNDVQIILDESFLNRSHFALLEKRPGAFIINLRISKMGGLIRWNTISCRSFPPGVSPQRRSSHICLCVPAAMWSSTPSARRALMLTFKARYGRLYI